MSASNDSLEQEVKDLRQDVAALRKALREEATKRKESTRAKLEDAAAETRAKLEGVAAENVERLRTAAGDAGGKAQEQLDQLEKQIEANPIPSVAGALFIGFVLGRLLGR